jgi:DNA polymerase-3 subunit delta
MALSKEKFRTEIERGVFRPVYVLYGEETYLRDNAAKFISLKAFSENDFRDFNDDSFSLSNPENISVALVAANQLPMMAQRRLVRITEVRVSTSAIKDTLKEESEDALKAYLSNPNPSTILVFVVDELNGSRKLGKILKSHEAAVDFRFPEDKETRKLAENVFIKAGVTIEPGAMNRLIELVGFDARRITSEAEKLATASLPDRTINKLLVDSLVRNSRESSNFDFARNLISGRKAEAVTALEKALSDGEEPLALLGLLAWQIRDELKKTSTNRTAYSNRLAHALERISDVDLAIKTSLGGSGKQSRKQLEMLVCELAVN